LGALRWLVVAVVTYAAVAMLRSALVVDVQPLTAPEPVQS